jgi:DNA-binding transcriptional LysR family regulator
VKLANVTISQLEYLAAALIEPTWKDAAEANAVSPSALSQGISELERRLGLRLFDKQGRMRVPTAEAEEAGVYATRILAEMRAFTRWAQEVRGGGAGRLSIGMIDTAAIHHFGDVLVSFRRARPELGFHLLVQPSNSLLDLLRAGEVDAVVCVDPDPDDRLTLQPLIAEPLYVYAPPGTEVGPPASWGPWVSFPADSRSRALVARRLRRAGAAFDVVAESSQPAVLTEMVRLGMGWTVLAPVDAETGPHALERASDEPVATRMLTLARRADRTPSPALAALLEVLTR